MLAASIAGGIFSFYGYGMPFNVDHHTGVIEPIPGIPLPAGIQPGDQIDLSATQADTRIALLTGPKKPAGHTYELVIRRGSEHLTVPFKNADYSLDTDQRVRFVILWLSWTSLSGFLVLGIISLLSLWRGHGRSARGMALWAVSVLLATAAFLLPLDGYIGLSVFLGSNFLFLLARVGFYIMIESILAASLTPRMRFVWRGIFIVLLCVGAAIIQFGGPILFVTNGLMGWNATGYALIWTAGYLIPVLMLLVNYRKAGSEQRLRLRWALWSGIAWLLGIFFNNTSILGEPYSSMASNSVQLLGMCGFLYAVLRHRLMDVSVILDRTLVYGGVTAVVVGILAAVNTVVQHAALGTSASLLLQIVVPLALGIVLSRVRTYADRTVEQVFFRKKYLAEKALRSFARRCGHIERTDRLLEAATTAIRQNLGATGIAFYERRGNAYVCVRRDGEMTHPQQVNSDDDAFVAARGDYKEVDLSELHSTLGTDGYVFPMMAHGVSQGVLVCANRPGEHYAA
ncbi:MAG: hypothetical protein ACRESO_02535, partial [Gammaproteobacteria bacterium]